LLLILSFCVFSSCADFVKLVAELGDMNAQYNLADLYYRGEGMPQDYAGAFKWYKKAAEQGHPGAQYGLGFMYYRGEGVPQNYIEGYVWSSVASAKNAKDANQQLAFIRSKMTPEQIAEAEKQADLLWEELNKKK